jgi:hypothetical protein
LASSSCAIFFSKLLLQVTSWVGWVGRRSGNMTLMGSCHVNRRWQSATERWSEDCIDIWRRNVVVDTVGKFLACEAERTEELIQVDEPTD